MSTHQLDEADFRSVLPEDIGWERFPAFPPSARLAVVVGDPSQPAPYVVRVKVPSDVKLMPRGTSDALQSLASLHQESEGWGGAGLVVIGPLAGLAVSDS